ncbi:hypothetical protein HZB03_04185 [Candidatus Woesearchaeota archaeon]|nr:hypothetical protein [Candidatus Woesearchaeota archaeon]
MGESKDDSDKTIGPVVALDSSVVQRRAGAVTSVDDLDIRILDDEMPTDSSPKKIDSVIPPRDIERVILFEKTDSASTRPSLHQDLVDRLEQALLVSHSLYPHHERVRSMVRHLSVSSQISRQGLELIINGIEWCNFSSFECDYGSSEDQKLGSFSHYVRQIASLEKIKNRNNNLHDGVFWLYSLIETWKPHLHKMSGEMHAPQFTSAVASSIPDLVRLLRIDVGARDIFEVYNRRVWQTPAFNSHSDLARIARSLECYKEGIPEQFTMIGQRIASIDDIKLGLDLHSLTCALPFSVHPKVLEFVGSGVDDILAEQTPKGGRKFGDGLERFLRNAVHFYQEYALDVANAYVDAFSNDCASISVSRAMMRISQQMQSLAEHRSEAALKASETTGIHTTRMLEREEAAARDLKENLAEAAAFMIERYNEITAKRGQEVAERFLETISWFREIDDGSRLLAFMNAYREHVLGTADDGEEEFVGTILREIGSLVNYDRSWKKTFDKLIGKGPTQCPPELQEFYQKKFGIRPCRVWDLRDYQRKLYEHPDAVQRFLAHANQRIDAKLYDRFVRKMNYSGRLEERIVLVGGGCGDARKELKIVECLEVEGIDVTLVLIDNSRSMRNRAALNCHDAGLHFPAILNRDIEKLTYEDLERDIDIQTQMVFFLGGGTPFNMMNRWYCYKKMHDIFDRRYQKRFGLPFGSKLHSQVSKRFLPDILVTEGDLEKSIGYYSGVDSLKFLSSGLEGEYKISSEAITVADDDTTLQIRTTAKGLQFSYFLMKDQGPFKKGDVLLVIESGILNKQQFRSWLSGVGFDCQFMDGKYKNTLAISKMCQIHPEYRKRVELAIKGYESSGR